MYADDIALLADSPEFLQLMLNISNQYAIKWRYTSKSVVLIRSQLVQEKQIGSSKPWEKLVSTSTR